MMFLIFVRSDGVMSIQIIMNHRSRVDDQIIITSNRGAWMDMDEE